MHQEGFDVFKQNFSFSTSLLGEGTSKSNKKGGSRGILSMEEKYNYNYFSLEQKNISL